MINFAQTGEGKYTATVAFRVDLKIKDMGFSEELAKGLSIPEVDEYKNALDMYSRQILSHIYDVDDIGTRWNDAEVVATVFGEDDLWGKMLREANWNTEHLNYKPY